MAKKANRSFLAIVGGIIALLGVGLSIFIKELGWWNFLSVVGENVEYTDIWASAFFGDTDPYFNAEFTYLLPGIIAAAGALLCLPGNKFLSLIGGVAVIGGLVVFLILLQSSYVGDIADLIGKSVFWDTGLFSKWRLGLGFFITSAGGISAIIGAFIVKK